MGNSIVAGFSCPRPRGALSDTVISPFVCLSHGAAACLGYRHAGCLQLSHRRSPEMCKLWTRPQTEVDPPRFLDPWWPDWRRNDMPPLNCHQRGHIVSPLPGRHLINHSIVRLSENVAFITVDNERELEKWQWKHVNIVSLDLTIKIKCYSKYYSCNWKTSVFIFNYRSFST